MCFAQIHVMGDPLKNEIIKSPNINTKSYI